MRPLFITPEVIQGMMSEITSKNPAGTYIGSNKISISVNLSTKVAEQVIVEFTPDAYQQMSSLIRHFNCEVAWHGTVNRVSEKHFVIEKILVYPQVVTASTVETDQAEYDVWKDSLSDEDFSALRFQGHSHVNMAPNPSSTDEFNEKRLINDLTKNDFYIFMIWNKNSQFTVRVVDMVKNTLYEGVDVKVVVAGLDTDTFLQEADKVVKKQTPKPSVFPNYYGYGPTVPVADGANVPATTASASKKTSCVANTNNSKEVTSLKEYYKEDAESLNTYGNSSCAPYYNNWY